MGVFLVPRGIFFNHVQVIFYDGTHVNPLEARPDIRLSEDIGLVAVFKFDDEV